MNDLTVTCGCGRTMAVDTMRGRGAYRCGCGARIKAAEPVYRPDRCVGLAGDLRCRKPPVTSPPVPLCWEHLGELKVAAGLIVPEEAEDFADLLAAARLHVMDEDVPKQFFLARMAQARARESGREADAVLRKIDRTERILQVVYFVRMGDLIKIGTTSNLLQRIQGLSLTMGHVLATEPGGYMREQELHGRFAALREHGEWFRAEPELLAYIDAIPARGRRRVS